MAATPRVEGVRHASYVLLDIPAGVISNNALVYDVFCCTPSWEEACCRGPAIAAFLNVTLVGILLELCCIMAFDGVFYIRHAAIAELDCVFVKDFSKFVVSRKTVFDKFKKFAPDVCLDLRIEGWIEP